MRIHLKNWFESRAHTTPALDYMAKKSVPQHRHAFWYTFGGFALFLLTLQFVTGILLLIRYVPSAAPAADPLTGKSLCMVRALDSMVVVVITDSTLFDYQKGERAVFQYSGKPEAGIPQELQGKVTILYSIPKDSTYIVSYTDRAVVPDKADDDTSAAPPVAIIEERADFPKEIRSHMEIVRDPSTKAIVHPSNAYASMERIMTVVPMGSFIRSLHAYGANLMVACIFLHMLSAFLMKGYRKPRELMWLSGVALFAVMLGFGFTGYLLPWNVLSYFATRVGVGYPESFIPGIGKYMADIMRGGSEVTGETLTRMFALHVVVLPLSTILLAGIHMAVLQVHGVSTPVAVRERGMGLMAAAAGAVSIAVLALYATSTTHVDFASPWVIIPLTVLPMVAAFFLGEIFLGSYKDSNGVLQPIPFYWNFAMRDYIGWLIGLGVLVALAIRAPWQISGVSGMPIDISQPLQTPPGIHPEWYFMFMFQFLRIVPGEIAMMMIGAAGAAWFVIPFLDKPSQREHKSTRFTMIGVAVILLFLSLTWFGYSAVEEELREAGHSAAAK